LISLPKPIGVNNSPTKEVDVKLLHRKDLKLFVLVMVAFAIGMAILLYFEVSAWWIWYGYFAVWTLVEYKIARNIPLRWWHWLLIIGAIILLDWGVLEIIEYVKR
jgi:hypothetical protein